MDIIKIVQIGPVNIASENNTYHGVRAKVTEVAVVKRTMMIGDKQVMAGTVLDPAFVGGLRRENRRALAENGYIELMPVSLELTRSREHEPALTTARARCGDRLGRNP
jgi:hypothetical protein